MSAQCPVMFVATEPGKPNYDLSISISLSTHWNWKIDVAPKEIQTLSIFMQKITLAISILTNGLGFEKTILDEECRYRSNVAGKEFDSLLFIYSMNQILSFKAATLRANLKNFAQVGDVSVPVPRCSFSLIIHPCVRMSICLCCPHQPHQSHRAASSSTCCFHLTSPSCSVCYNRSSLSLSWMKIQEWKLIWV